MDKFNLKEYLKNNRLLKEEQMEGKYIETTSPKGYDIIISFEELTEDDLGLDYGTLSDPNMKKVEERDGVKIYTYYI